MKVRKITKGLTIMFALLAAVAGGWASFRFGPKPVEANLTQTKSSSEAPQPVPVTQIETPDVIANPYSELLGFSQDSMKVGESAEPVEKYIERLEILYERRGYYKGSDQGSPPKNENHQPANKLYWREDADIFTMICAVGIDSDPNSNIKPRNHKSIRPSLHRMVRAGQNG
jgi:hypothetical protein